MRFTTASFGIILLSLLPNLVLAEDFRSFCDLKADEVAVPNAGMTGNSVVRVKCHNGWHILNLSFCLGINQDGWIQKQENGEVGGYCTGNRLVGSTFFSENCGLNGQAVQKIDLNDILEVRQYQGKDHLACYKQVSEISDKKPGDIGPSQ